VRKKTETFNADSSVILSQNNLFFLSSSREYLPLTAIFLTIVLTFLHLSNRNAVWWCPSDPYELWSGNVWSRHNSQHLLDPYTLTHFLYGILCFWIINFNFKKLSLRWQFFLVVLFACTWEIVENSAMMIERYRTITVSADYAGDSLINSLSDIFSCCAGFYLVRKLTFKISLALFMFIELAMLFWIRDNLLLNVLMLIYPIDAIKHWQMNM
jgi:Protein of unknown function (DUF2585)